MELELSVEPEVSVELEAASTVLPSVEETVLAPSVLLSVESEP